MHWERLSEDVYVFTSDRYAQVTASLIVSGSIGVVIDTLPFPQETSQIALFARRRCPDGVRYVVYTQHQADHTYGAFLFPKAEIISHALCREILLEKGFKALEQARALNHDLELVRLRIPNLTFENGAFTLRLPGKTLDLFATPGHTPDAISVILQEEKVLFAGDTIMAIPTIGEGDLAQLRESTEAIAAMSLESIVQGHGEIILRGEIKDNIKRSLNYLDQLNAGVRKLVETGGTLEDARKITLESCGLQRVLLNGMVTQLHAANVLALYRRLMAELGPVVRETAKAVAPAPEEATPKAPVRTARKTARKPAAKKKPARAAKKTARKKAVKKGAVTKRRTS
ncbi:MAG: MBL fold metallo-hydrolase [Chloroflexi bacterium]|nr:MBL fold metallo-hydrolase [Chloroflexota bacterium]MCL5274623.1 MBL fold metallo-hydrolase [Chloroflexota bacterium]